MRAYRVTIDINLDDDGYLEEKCWILDAISEQLQDDEQIVRYKVQPLTSEDEVA